MGSVHCQEDFEEVGWEGDTVWCNVAERAVGKSRRPAGEGAMGEGGRFWAQMQSLVPMTVLWLTLCVKNSLFYLFFFLEKVVRVHLLKQRGEYVSNHTCNICVTKDSIHGNTLPCVMPVQR